MNFSNDTIWLETYEGELINLRHVIKITPCIFTSNVTIRANLVNAVPYVDIAECSTTAVAEKFIKKLSKMIESDVKCIDARLLAEQSENESNIH